MGFWNKILKTEQNIRKRIENAFGHGTAQTPLEVRREILEQVESRIVVDSNGNQFRYGKIIVSLQPKGEAQRDVFETAFLHDGALKTDIIEKLKDSQVRYPEELQVAVELTQPAPDQAEPPGLFHIEFVKLERLRKRDVPEIKLAIVKGSTEQPVYVMKKERITIGRLTEVMDREGRMVRRNDVVFLDNKDDINSTVGRVHARIWFDFEKYEFCIMDEVSRYGTQIVREGRSIEVPGGNPRGVFLRPGDEIYLGQACLRFELPG
jgi:hypothetical protein